MKRLLLLPFIVLALACDSASVPITAPDDSGLSFNTGPKDPNPGVLPGAPWQPGTRLLAEERHGGTVSSGSPSTAVGLRFCVALGTLDFDYTQPLPGAILTPHLGCENTYGSGDSFAHVYHSGNAAGFDALVTGLTDGVDETFWGISAAVDAQGYIIMFGGTGNNESYISDPTPADGGHPLERSADFQGYVIDFIQFEGVVQSFNTGSTGVDWMWEGVPRFYGRKAPPS